MSKWNEKRNAFMYKMQLACRKMN